MSVIRKKTVVRRVLDRVIVVSKDELETTYIVHGRPLADTIEILGLGSNPKIIDLSRKDNPRGVYLPPRPMHVQPPLSYIAQPLGLEIWVRFYDIDGVPIYFVEEPQPTELTRKIYIYMKMRLGERGITKPSDVLDFFKETLEDAGVDPMYALAEPDVKAALYYVWRDLLGYGPLEIPMEDPHIEDVSWFAYDGPVEVADRKVADVYPNAEFVPTNIFIDPALDDTRKKFIMTQVVRAIAAKARVGLTTAKPVAEARIEDPVKKAFHRLAAHLDITSRSPGLTIRKFPEVKFSLVYLIHQNTLSPLLAGHLLWQLIRRGFVLIVGGMGSGKSVGKDSHLLIRRRGSIRLVTIESLWAELVEDGFSPVIINGMEVIENPDIEILSLDRNGVRWYRPKYLIRHRYSGKIFKIRTKTGRVIEVTPDHSLLVWSVGDEKDRFSIILKPVKPSEIKGRAYLPYLRKVDLPEKTGTSGRIADPRFGYLIGFFIAKGYFNGYTPRVHQSVGTILSHVLDYMTELGISYRVSPDKRKPHLRYISILDREIRKFIDPREIGRKAREKRIPTLFWNMSEEWRCAFLAGIIDGDGTVHTGKHIIEIATASKELAYGLLYAFATVGVHAYLRAKKMKKYPGRVYYRVFVPISINEEPLRRIMKWLSTEKRIKIEEVIRKSSNQHSETDIVPVNIAYAIGSHLKRLEHGRDEGLSFELRGHKYEGVNLSFHRMEKILGEKLFEFIPRHVGFDEVVEIAEEDYDGYVYDLEVPETENFEANGVFVHNTTLLQALISALPISYKVVTIEDTPELSTPAQNWHPLYIRRAPKESELENIDFPELVKHSLRHRGTVVTLGEVRGAEMADLIQAAASGHGAICLPGDEVVVLRVDGKEVLSTMSEAVRMVAEGRRVEVLSYDIKRGEVVWRPIRAAIATKTDRWVVLRTDTGRVLRVTPDHLVPVRRRTGSVEFRRADEVELGDEVPVLARVPSRRDAKRFIVVDGIYVPLDESSGRLLGYFIKSGRVYSKTVSLPLDAKPVVEEIAARLRIPVRVGARRVFMTGSRAVELVNTLLRTVEESPLSLPQNFVSALYAVLGVGEYPLPIRTAYALHYALKTLRVDSVVVDRGGAAVLRILGARVGNDEVVWERVVSIRYEDANDDAYDFEVEGSHTFVHGSSVVTHNCTFHAHDPESVLARITSPPINAAPESLKLITSIVHIAKTKCYASGLPVSVRRVVRVYEIKEVKGRNVVSRVVFEWNPLTDEFTPPTSEEGVVELWRRSRTLRVLGYNQYVEEAPRAAVEVYAIARYLELLARKGVFDIKSVLHHMTSFYLRLDKVTNELWERKFKKVFADEVRKLKERGLE